MLYGGNGSGVFDVADGDVTVSGVTITADGARVTGGQLTLFDVDAKGPISVNTGKLVFTKSTSESGVSCGLAATGSLTAMESELFTVNAYSCTVDLERDTFANFQGYSNALITTNLGVFTIENNVVVTDDADDDAIVLGGSDGSTFRFNTLVNLSGEDHTATAISCGGAKTSTCRRTFSRGIPRRHRSA